MFVLQFLFVEHMDRQKLKECFRGLVNSPYCITSPHYFISIPAVNSTNLSVLLNLSILFTPIFRILFLAFSNIVHLSIGILILSFTNNVVPKSSWFLRLTQFTWSISRRFTVILIYGLFKTQ